MRDPRAYTAEEVEEMILRHIWTLVGYWDTMVGERPTRDRLSGLAFSILTMLDGCGMDIPAFKLVPHPPRIELVPDPHPSDEEYHKENGDNWFDPETVIETMLHEAFHRFEPQGRSDRE